METSTMVSSPLSAEEWWLEYQQTRSEQTKDRLVLHYLPLVKYVIGRMFWNLPSHVPREDLMSCGVMGLIDAVGRFSPERRIRFETFAIPRIRGAILDELRTYDLLPRSVRVKMKEVQKAIRDLEAGLHRSPNEEEIARKLKMSVEEYQDLLRDLGPVCFFSISASFRAESEFETIEPADPEDPDLAADNLELRNTLVAAIQNLPKNERLIITLYYYEEMTMKEIGMVLKVSEARISQLHTQAILKLRSTVENR
jgi:RNA polymerase sigma factor for flagellar operon FliA